MDNTTHGVLGSLVPPALGIVSRTLVQSPTLRWLYSVRLRSEDQHEVAMFGDNFIHIKEFDANGRLCHLVTIDSFNARIRSGGVLGIEATFKKKHPPLVIEGELLKVEVGLTKAPPQFMVVSTSDPPELRFLIVEDRSALTPRFHEHIRPVPDLDAHTLHQPGSLIAVDPYSRCFALAADADNLIVYLVKDLGDLMTAYNTDRAAWDPVRDEQILRVDGTILRMHFLRVDNDNPNSVVLVLVVGKNKRTSIQWFIWDLNEDHIPLNDALRNPHGSPYVHRLPPDLDTPHLLIPSQYAPSFVMVYHEYLVIASQTMTGHLEITSHIDFGIGSDDEPQSPHDEPQSPHDIPLSAVVSGKLPVWTGWSKGISNDNWADTTKEQFYIVREDGKMFYFTAEPLSLTSTYMGQFAGFVDQGFACCEVDTSLQNPYYMVAAGVMSPGEVKQIGKHGESIYTGGRSEALKANPVDRIENWSPTKDLIFSDLSDGAQRVGSKQRTSLFMTAGRGPLHGAIVEMKRGVAAHVGHYFAIGEPARTTALWMLDDDCDSIFLVASLPEATSVFHTPSNYSEVAELTDENCDMRLDRPTLLASVLSSGHLMQITSSEVIILKSHGTALAESAVVSSAVTLGSSIVCAAIDVKQDSLLLALRNSSGFAIRAVRVKKYLVDAGDAEEKFETGELMRLPAEPTSLSFFTSNLNSYAAASTAGGHLQVFRLDEALGLHLVLDHRFSGQPEAGAVSPTICGSLAHFSEEFTSSDAFALICGMRDGSVAVLDLIPGDPNNGNVDMTDHPTDGALGMLQIRNLHVQMLGTTPVILSMDGSGATQNVYALCGTNVVRIRVYDDVNGSEAVSYDEVVLRPKFHPSSHSQSIRGLSPVISTGDHHNRMALVRGDEIAIAHVDHQVNAIPLNLGLKNSTPEHVIYCERLAAFIVASTRIKLSYASTPSSRWRGKRMTYAQIDIVSTAHALDGHGQPLRLGELELWPGERINAMLDWKFKDAKGRKHAQLVVATALPQQNSNPMKGRLLFLSLKRDEDGHGVDIVPTKDSLYEESVRSIAAYSDRELVVATGLKVLLVRLVIEPAGARWVKVCRKELRSPAVHITAEAPFIHVSTTDDSLVVLRLTTQEPSAGQLGEDNSDDDEDSDNEEAMPEQTLETVFTDSEARDIIHHLPLHLELPGSAGRARDDTMDVDSRDGAQQRTNLVLLSDRSCNMTGLFIPSQSTQGTAVPTMFEVQLPRSLMRIAQGPVRPPWRQTPADAPGARNILADDLLGASIDGAVYQFSIVDETAWRVLKVLENAAKLKELVRCEAAGRYVHEDEWEQATRLPSGAGLLDKASFHIDGDLLARHHTTQAEMQDLLGYALHHSRYRGPDADVFAGDVRGLLELRNDCGLGELFGRLYAWYRGVVMPML